MLNSASPHYLPLFRTSYQLREYQTKAFRGDPWLQVALSTSPHYNPIYTIPQSRKQSFYVSILNTYVKNMTDYCLSEMLPLKYKDRNSHFSLQEYISLTASFIVGMFDFEKAPAFHKKKKRSSIHVWHRKLQVRQVIKKNIKGKK